MFQLLNLLQVENVRNTTLKGLKQVELRNGLPFEVVIPNDITRRTFSNTDTGKDLIVCEDADDMFRKLGI